MSWEQLNCDVAVTRNEKKIKELTDLVAQLEEDHKTFAEGAAKVVAERDKYWRQSQVFRELLKECFQYLDDEDWAMRKKIEDVLEP